MEACHAASCGGEALGAVARSIFRLRGVAAEWKLRRRRLAIPLGRRNSGARMQEAGDWAATRSAVRMLIGRRKRAFRRSAPMLGDDGKPLASLQDKANQHQCELTEEFG